MIARCRGETDHIAVYRYILTELQRCLSDDSMEDKEGAVMVWRMLALMWRKNGVSMTGLLKLALVEPTCFL